MDDGLTENSSLAHLKFEIARGPARGPLLQVESANPLVLVVLPVVLHIEVHRVVLRHGPLASSIQAAVCIWQHDGRRQLAARKDGADRIAVLEVIVAGI